MTMPQKRHPWMKWWPSHDRSEPTLKLCSRAARSFWHDMVGLMHESPLIGHLLINGKPPTPDQLARVLGDDIRDVAKWIEELHENGVYSETDDGIVYSRRMVRDAEAAEFGRSSVKKRGGAWTEIDGNGPRVPTSPPNRVPDRAPDTKRIEDRGKSKDLVGPVPEPTVSKAKGYPEDFEEFWVAYPRNPNMSKAEAGKSWAKLKQGGLLPVGGQMARAVAAYRSYLAEQSRNRPTPFPAAHAATWLNQRRFEGFLEAPAVPVGVNTGPGWETEFPDTWGKVRAFFKEMPGGDAQWVNWFSKVRPNGSPYTLVCGTRFECDQLEERFGDRLAKVFGQRVRFTMATTPPASPPETELRH